MSTLCGILFEIKPNVTYKYRCGFRRSSLSNLNLAKVLVLVIPFFNYSQYLSFGEAQTPNKAPNITEPAMEFINCCVLYLLLLIV